MAIYHETRRSQSLPRMIGSSKAACYLCDAFIRAHGIFQVSKAHRQVYNQWTVPGSPRLDARTMHRLSAALGQVDEEVREELSLAQGCRRGRLYPFQSSINLHNTVISTRSNSTVSPLPQSREGRQSNICQVKLSTPAATSDDTEKFSSQAPIRSPQRSNTVENAILTVFDRLSSENRSGSACKSSKSVERLHNLASSISPSPPENYGKVTPKLEMIRSSPPFVGPNSNAATELTAREGRYMPCKEVLGAISLIRATRFHLTRQYSKICLSKAVLMMTAMTWLLVAPNRAGETYRLKLVLARQGNCKLVPSNFMYILRRALKIASHTRMAA